MLHWTDAMVLVALSLVVAIAVGCVMAMLMDDEDDA